MRAGIAIVVQRKIQMKFHHQNQVMEGGQRRNFSSKKYIYLSFHFIFLFHAESSSSSDSDILQVFIGNISHKASEVELRNIFAKFGRITRFRIHSNPSKANRPNYAFVTYENLDAVKRCLVNRVTNKFSNHFNYCSAESN